MTKTSRMGDWATFVAEDRGGSIAEIRIDQLSGYDSVPEERLACSCYQLLTMEYGNGDGRTIGKVGI